MTTCPTTAPGEPQRLEALRRLHLINSPVEERFERITRVAKRVLQVEITALSLIDDDQQFFKSIQGLDVRSTPRDRAFCAHTILSSDPFVVEDATKDPRFADNPLVTGEPGIRAYAGIPLESADGQRIGALCAIHGRPRTFSKFDLLTLTDLAHIAESELRHSDRRSITADFRAALSIEQRAQYIDPITQTWNQRATRELIDRHVGDPGFNASGAALIKIDLDAFSAVNQQHGEAAANEAISEAARRMLSAVRADDAFGRLEDDNFIALIPRCPDARQAETIATRLLNELIQLPVITQHAAIDLAASVGGVFIPQDQP
ncbi:MAG: sensor domain-containing diguanylate cyclase, partial [Planctomycetota bacterium]